MVNVKGFFVIGIIFMFVILIIPTVLVAGFSGESVSTNDWNTNEDEGMLAVEELAPDSEPGDTDGSIEEVGFKVDSVSVFRSQSEIIEEVSLEDYIVGVVASEMPVSYEVEALKAQALTARTYLIRQLLDGHGPNLPEGADVTDTVMQQVYKSEQELEEDWGGDFDWKIARIRQAVHDTEGQIITYDNEPITAQFFSTSNGYTENSEEYWENEIPYLRSVESPWDTESPRFEGKKEMSVQEIEERLEVQVTDEELGEIVSRTTGGRVSKVVIGGQTFSGREVRDALELDSSDFSWYQRGENVVIETRGWGHGVGMSQFGADGMAREGHNYLDIIHYYYQGVDVEDIETVLAKNSNNESLASR